MIGRGKVWSRAKGAGYPKGGVTLAQRANSTRCAALAADACAALVPRERVWATAADARREEYETLWTILTRRRLDARVTAE